MVDNDARTGMPFGIPKGAICVRRFDDSLNSAIRITYRISLRSSSLPEPRYPLLRVVLDCLYFSSFQRKNKEISPVLYMGKNRVFMRFQADVLPCSSCSTL